MSDIQFLSNTQISHKKVLLRVDYNVDINEAGKIQDDIRITETLPTLNKLLAEDNTIVLLSHLGRPKGKEENLSLKPVSEHLKHLLPHVSVEFVPDVLHKEAIQKAMLTAHIVFTENIRFYPEEDTNNYAFGHHLASLADVYINDAFSVSHRAAASIVGVPKFIPGYAGFLFEKEVASLSRLTKNPDKPFVAVLGGSKISTKLPLIKKLTKLADHVLLGGGLANTLLVAEGKEVGKSLVDNESVESIKDLVSLASSEQTRLMIPVDVRVGAKNDSEATIKLTGEVMSSDEILDIGPKTEEAYKRYLEQANTIVWNGPMGYFENSSFSFGTDAIYRAIAANSHVFSIIGGGETLAAIKNEPYKQKISHISTAGGAMLEFIEKGTLPGIDALRHTATDH